MAILWAEFKVDLQARFTNVFSWSSLFTCFKSLIIRGGVCEKLSWRIICAADDLSCIWPHFAFTEWKGFMLNEFKKTKDNLCWSLSPIQGDIFRVLLWNCKPYLHIWFHRRSGPHLLEMCPGTSKPGQEFCLAQTSWFPSCDTHFSLERKERSLLVSNDACPLLSLSFVFPPTNSS